MKKAFQTSWINVQLNVNLTGLQALVRFGLPWGDKHRWVEPGEVLQVTSQGTIAGSSTTVLAKALIQKGLVGPRWPLSLVWKVKPYRPEYAFVGTTEGPWIKKMPKSPELPKRRERATDGEIDRFDEELRHLGVEWGATPRPPSVEPTMPIPEDMWDNPPSTFNVNN